MRRGTHSVVMLIALVLGSIYVGIATRRKPAAFGVVGSLILSVDAGPLNRHTLFAS